MSLLAGRKFLVVGGNGFVGNRIAAKLIQLAAQVSVFSRYSMLNIEQDLNSNILKTNKSIGSLAMLWNPNDSKIK
jgi:nucleoside-diphosphate-sugar epimerase